MSKLVVYFSYTGNTRMIANKIKEKLNCDILEIKTVIPYSEDYQSVVDDEQNSEASNHLPKIQDITIKPFATNAGWLGRTFKEIGTLCSNSKVDNGMNIVFESYSDKLVTKEQDIDNWISTL